MFFEMFFVQDETCCRFPGNVDIHNNFSNGGLVRAALTGVACWCSVWESRVSA